MVHQHFRLVSRSPSPRTSFWGTRDVGRSFLLHPRAIEPRVAKLGERYGMAVDPRARIWQLSVGEQQRVEILKALYREARILILDEPTAVLTPQEADALFVTLRAMAAEGRTVIFISHKLHEVMAVADRVTVLRGGRTVAHPGRPRDATPAVARRADGRPRRRSCRRDARAAPQSARSRSRSTGSARGDRGARRSDGVSLNVRAGEILGVAGVAGNGQRELAEAITGMRPPSGRARRRVDGAPLARGDPRAAIEAGVAHVPEDRLHTGVAPSLSIA